MNLQEQQQNEKGKEFEQRTHIDNGTGGLGKGGRNIEQITAEKHRGKMEIIISEQKKKKKTKRGRENLQAKVAVGFLLNGGSGREVILDVGPIQVQFGARGLELPRDAHAFGSASQSLLLRF